MVGQRDPLIADLFRRLHKIADRIGLAADIDDRQGHAEFHLPLHPTKPVSLRAQRSNLVHSRSADRDCFVAPLVAMTIPLAVIIGRATRRLAMAYRAV